MGKIVLKMGYVFKTHACNFQYKNVIDRQNTTKTNKNKFTMKLGGEIIGL